ncbi:hypothetical protein P12x_005454 [Tundrisphaera lichenicola]|uniref:hypothetical protein n=1 Tax=Tundrisphaera lichenicola TaxID=2029860 RepID=UPI003EBB4E50
MEVISVHVPKTAGSTFGNLLTTIHGVDRVYKDYEDYPMNPLSRYNLDREGWRESARAEVQSIGEPYRAVHGHFAIRKYDGFFPEARRIAWVRHPAAWVTSLYYFWKGLKELPPGSPNPLIVRLRNEDLPLREFAEDPTVRDRIAGTFLEGLEPEAFFFLGVQEHFDSEIRDLIGMMGWPEVSAGFENRNPVPGYADRSREILGDRTLTELLIALNPRDMELYEAASRIREERARRRVHFLTSASGTV